MHKPGFLFLGGCARSGTGALWTVVTADPAVALGIERYVHLVRNPEQFKPELFERDRFLEIQPGDTFYESFDSFGFEPYRHVVARYGGARLVGDKIPMLHPLYEPIARNFDQPRILYILRNPFDVAASYQRRAMDEGDETWLADRDYRAACHEWNASVRATCAWIDRLSLCVVDYEAFFSGLADISRLAAFLRVDPDLLQSGYEEVVGRTRTDPHVPLTRLARQYIARVADFDAYRELLSFADRTRFPGWPSARSVPRGEKKYEAEDRRVVDYQYHEAVPGKWFRGPAPTASKVPSIAFLGAASTFGRLVEDPYPSIVSRQLGAQAVNLGYGGARAPFYYTDHRLLALINRCRCAVIELFSARGTATPTIEPRDHQSAFVRLRELGSEFEFADHLFARLLTSWTQGELHRLTEEIGIAYMHEMTELLRRIEVPTVLLWFSQRAPHMQPAFDGVAAYMGEFPHFVTAPIVADLSGKADAFVEVVSRAGIPSRVTDRDSGAPVAIFDGTSEPDMNFYYPSPLMHDAAAQALAQPLAAVLARTASDSRALV